MKIIHSADQHLDSGMNTHLPDNKAYERRAEILKTFAAMVDYAVNNDVAAILLSGDLFDTVSVSRNVQNTVLSLIKNNSDITFYYLKGNHDNKSFVAIRDELPKNLKTFSDDWISYKLTDRITISGTELTSENAEKIYDDLMLKESDINICMLHGQVSATQSDIAINMQKLANKYIDYLALGHVHEYKKDKIDARGTWCYSGCLEGRGFDEPGDKGFVLLDIDENSSTVKSEFVPFAGRKICYLELDVSEDTSTVEVENRINSSLSDNSINQRDIVDIRLTGNVSEDMNIDVIYLTKRFENNYYYIRIKDRTKIKIDYSKYAADMSLKGEFIRTVLADDSLNADEKGEIISVGLKALGKEDINSYICKKDNL